VTFADTPLTVEIVGAIRRDWGLALDTAEQAERLHGGEESAAYRIGSHVVRVGPSWRASAELEWCHAVAAAAAKRVPEAIAPCRTKTGSTVVRGAGRPITVWPFVDGSWGDDTDRQQRGNAAELLARLHRALTRVSHAAPPAPSAPRVAVPDLGDVSLDAWLADFDRRHPIRQPLHGDFYARNVLVRDRRIVALLDWDEAFLGPPERELAWAAWEWGDGLATRGSDLEGVRTFVADYVAAGGPARLINDETLRQLVRQRIRREVAYARAAHQRGVALDDDDRSYEARQLQAFRHLRP
jgi:Ser/Thr protein kinase RdoA (MazF antagonist)